MDASVPTASLEVRTHLVEALKLALVGPGAGHALAEERLPGWERPPEQSGDADEDDEMSEVPETAGLAEESAEDRRAAKKGYFPSSMGLSFLVSENVRSLFVVVRWGDYAPDEIEGSDGKPLAVWQRSQREETIPVALAGRAAPLVPPVPGSGGLQLHVVERRISADDLADHIPAGTRSVSVFLVNHREPLEDESDRAYAFQPQIEVRGEEPFVPRPDPRGALAQGWDEQVADLHYADTPAYATGHGVSAEWEITDGVCRLLRTAWIPSAEVEKTETVPIEGVEVSMDVLGGLADGAAAKKALEPLVERYREWIEERRVAAGGLSGHRRETAGELLRLAGVAAGRIERGIAVLAADADALDAFRVANRAVARALRQRLKDQLKGKPPSWRAFQLAFLLLNLPGLADPRDPHRETVDLLFFRPVCGSIRHGRPQSPTMWPAASKRSSRLGSRVSSTRVM